MATEFLTLPEILKKFRFSESTLRRMRRKGKFPSPVRVDGYRLRWRKSDIDKWVRNLERVDIADGAAENSPVGSASA